MTQAMALVMAFCESDHGAVNMIVAMALVTHVTLTHGAVTRATAHQICGRRSHGYQVPAVYLVGAAPPETTGYQGSGLQNAPTTIEPNLCMT